MIDAADYAREVEAYLCRKNGGHLIRVVGPAFQLVSGWAASGVPLKVAFKGIDRCCARHEARGPRRRPLRIEFCEADVLEAFDDWRRAVGVPAAGADEPGSAGAADAPGRKPALRAHIERATARLAYARGSADHGLQATLDGTIRELEEMVVPASRARGDARAALASRLAELDAALIAAAASGLDEGRTAALRQEAADELSAFGARMPPEARARALQGAFERLVRETFGLPTLTYDV